MVPGFRVGTVVTAPCCLHIYPSALLHTTGVQAVPRERERLAWTPPALG